MYVHVCMYVYAYMYICSNAKLEAGFNCILWLFFAVIIGNEHFLYYKICVNPLGS